MSNDEQRSLIMRNKKANTNSKAIKLVNETKTEKVEHYLNKENCRRGGGRERGRLTEGGRGDM